MKVIEVPSNLERERSVDALIEGLNEADGRVLLDARRLKWVDPFGMLGLLAVGEVALRRDERPVLHLPESAEVLSYLTRMGFFEQADRIFELHRVPRRNPETERSLDVLLEVTPIRSHADIHAVVEHVNEAALAILTKQLNYPLKEAFQFSVILSEVCQNIIEHSGAHGWVATQTYNWAKRLGRKVVMIAVMDLGVGFRGSLASEHAARFAEAWGDAAALEAAFIHGATRFRDVGRGQGLQQIRKQVGRWGGKFSIRSGTARIADVPPWDDVPALEIGLSGFPGAQICIMLPERVEAEREPSPVEPAARQGR